MYRQAPVSPHGETCLGKVVEFRRGSTKRRTNQGRRAGDAGPARHTWLARSASTRDAHCHEWPRARASLEPPRGIVGDAGRATRRRPLATDGRDAIKDGFRSGPISRAIQRAAVIASGGRMSRRCLGPRGAHVDSAAAACPNRRSRASRDIAILVMVGTCESPKAIRSPELEAARLCQRGLSFAPPSRSHIALAAK